MKSDFGFGFVATRRLSCEFPFMISRLQTRWRPVNVALRTMTVQLTTYGNFAGRVFDTVTTVDGFTVKESRYCSVIVGRFLYRLVYENPQNVVL